MTKTTILIEGYTSGDTGGRSCCTVTLVQDGDINMIIDPGTTSSQQVLVDALKKENLSIEDINVVGITHAHTDHNRNVGMFQKAKVIDYWGWWEGDLWTESNGRVSDNIEIIKTPGHSDDSITFLIQTDDGITAICGDVFWKENEPEKDAYANNLKMLEASRQLVLKKADYIIPGHGRMYITG
ncbi:MBL fold metallo-hydrolase [Candidatus Peregrinibacteria bacterium]|nr:MBL fold metallo-hydrolase [Candidatus Peregrinibacteria bacterium]